MPKVDWLTADMQGLSKMESLADYYQSGKNPKDFTLLDKEAYWKNENVQKAFAGEDGKPDRKKFDSFYKITEQRYKDFQNENYDQLNVQSLQGYVYDTPLNRLRGAKTLRNPVTMNVKNQDPLHRDLGVDGINEEGKAKMSERQSASRFVMNPETGELENFEDKKWEYFLNGNIFKVAKNEDGSLKLHDKNGQPYIEAVSSDTEIKSTDTQVGLMDDWFGGMHNQEEGALKTSLAFVPRGFSSALMGIAGATAELIKTGADLAGDEELYDAANGVKNLANSFVMANTDKSQVSVMDDLNFENVMGLTGEVFAQLQSGRAIGTVAGGGAKFLLGKLAATGALKMGDEAVVAGSNFMAKVAARGALTVMGAGDIAQQAREHGLTPAEAAVVHAASLTFLYHINKLSDPMLGILDGAAASASMKEVTRNVFASAMKSAAAGGQKMSKEALKSMGQKIGAGFLGTYRKALSADGLPGGAMRESFEETLEQVLDLGIRAGFNMYADHLRPESWGDGKFDPINIDQELKAMGEAAIGGAIGGGLSGGYNGLANKDQQETIQRYVAQGKAPELRAELTALYKKGVLGPSHIGENGELLTEEQLRGGAKSMNDVAFRNAIEAVNTLESVYKNLGIEEIKNTADKELKTRQFEKILDLTSLKEDVDRLATGIAKEEEGTEKAEQYRQKLEELKKGETLGRYLEEGLYNYHKPHAVLTGKGFNQLNEDVVRQKEVAKEEYKVREEMAKENLKKVQEGKEAEILPEDRDALVEEYIQANPLEELMKPLMEKAEAGDENAKYLLEDITAAQPATLQELEKVLFANPEDLQPNQDAFPEAFKAVDGLKRLQKIPVLEEAEEDVPALLRTVEQDEEGSLRSGNSLPDIVEQEKKATENETYANIEGLQKLKGSIQKRMDQIDGLRKTQQEVQIYNKRKGLEDRLNIEEELLDTAAAELDRLEDEVIKLLQTHAAREGNRERMQALVDGQVLAGNLELLKQLNLVTTEQGTSMTFQEKLNEREQAIAEALDEKVLDLIQARKLLTEVEVALHEDLKGHADSLYEKLAYKQTKFSTTTNSFIDKDYAAYAYLKKLETLHPAEFFNKYKEVLPQLAHVSSVEQEEAVRYGLAFVLDEEMKGRGRLQQRVNKVDFDIRNALFMEGYQGTGKTSQVLAVISLMSQQFGKGKTLALAHKAKQKANLKASLKAAGAEVDNAGDGFTLESFVEEYKKDKNKLLAKVRSIGTIVVDEATHIAPTTLVNFLSAVEKINQHMNSPIRVVLAGDTTQSGHTRADGLSDNLSSWGAIHRTPAMTMPFRTGVQDVLYAVDYFRYKVGKPQSNKKLEVSYNAQKKLGLNVQTSREAYDKAVQDLIEHARENKELDQVAYVTDKPSNVPAGISADRVFDIASIQGQEFKYVVMDLESREHSSNPSREMQNARDLLTGISRAKEYVVMRSYGSRPIKAVEGNPVKLSVPEIEGRLEKKNIELEEILKPFNDIPNTKVRAKPSPAAGKGPAPGGDPKPAKGDPTGTSPRPDDKAPADHKGTRYLYMRPFARSVEVEEDREAANAKRNLLYPPAKFKGTMEYYLVAVPKEELNNPDNRKLYQANKYEFSEDTVIMMGKITYPNGKSQEVMLGVLDDRWGVKPGEPANGHTEALNALKEKPNQRLYLDPRKVVLPMLRETQAKGNFRPDAVYNPKVRMSLAEARKKLKDIVIGSKIFIAAEDGDGYKAGQPFVFYTSNLNKTQQDVDRNAMEGRHEGAKLGKILLDTRGKTMEELAEIFEGADIEEDKSVYMSDNIRAALAEVINKMKDTSPVAAQLWDTKAIVKLSDEQVAKRKKIAAKTGKKDKYLSEYMVNAASLFAIINENLKNGNPIQQESVRKFMREIHNHPEFRKGILITPARVYGDVYRLADGRHHDYMVAQSLTSGNIELDLEVNLPQFSPGAFSLRADRLDLSKIGQGPTAAGKTTQTSNSSPTPPPAPVKKRKVSQSTESWTMGEMEEGLKEVLTLSPDRHGFVSLQEFADTVFQGVYNAHLPRFISHFKRKTFRYIIDRYQGRIEYDANQVANLLEFELQDSIAENADRLQRTPAELLGSEDVNDFLAYYDKVALLAKDYLLKKYFDIELDHAQGRYVYTTEAHSHTGRITENKETLNMAKEGVNRFIQLQLENIPLLEKDESGEWSETGKYLEDAGIDGHAQLVRMFQKAPVMLDTPSAEKAYLKRLADAGDQMAASFYYAVHNTEYFEVNGAEYHSLTSIAAREAEEQQKAAALGEPVSRHRKALNKDMVKAVSSAINSFTMKSYAPVDMDLERTQVILTSLDYKGFTKLRFIDSFHNTAFKFNTNYKNPNLKEKEGKYIPVLSARKLKGTPLENLQKMGFPVSQEVIDRYINKYGGSEKKLSQLVGKLIETLESPSTDDPIGETFTDLDGIIRAYEDVHGVQEILTQENAEGNRVYLLNQKSPIHDFHKRVTEVAGILAEGGQTVFAENPLLKKYRVDGVFIKDGIRGFNKKTRKLEKKAYSQFSPKEVMEMSINWLYSDILFRSSGRKALIDVMVYADKSVQNALQFSASGNDDHGMIYRTEEGAVDVARFEKEIYASQSHYYRLKQEQILEQWMSVIAAADPEIQQQVMGKKGIFPKKLKSLQAALEPIFKQAKKDSDAGTDSVQRAFVKSLSRTSLMKNMGWDAKSGINKDFIAEVEMYAPSQGSTPKKAYESFQKHMRDKYKEFIADLLKAGYDTKGATDKLGSKFFEQGMQEYDHSRHNLSSHPVLKHYFYQWNLLSVGTTQLSTGSIFQYKGGDVAAKYGDQVKRNHMMTSGFQKFVLNDEEDNYGLDKYSKVLTVDDPEGRIYNIISKTHNQEVMDGASLVNPLTRIKQHNSLGGDYGFGAEGNIKPITSGIDPVTGDAFFIKNAEFVITNEILRKGSESIRNMVKTMLNVPFYEGEESAEYASALDWLQKNYGEQWWKESDEIWYELHDFLVDNGLQGEVIDEISYPTSQKTGTRNVISQEQAESGQPAGLWREVSNENKGIMLQAMHDPYSHKEVSPITQIFSSMSLGGGDFSDAVDVYQALAVIAEQGLREIEAKGPFADFTRKLIKEKVLKEDKEGSLQKLVLQTDEEGNPNFPLSDKKLLNMWHSEMSSILNKQTIKPKFEGGQFVVSPANGIIPVVETEAGVMMKDEAEALGLEGVERNLKWNDYTHPTHGNLFETEQFLAYKEAMDLKPETDEEKAQANALRVERATALQALLSGSDWVVGDAEIILPNVFRDNYKLPVGESLQNVIQNGPAYFLPRLQQEMQGKSEEDILLRAEALFESFQKAMEIFAARIPATGPHSGVNMRIVGFVDSTQNSMYVPIEMLYIQGADQDIDKGNIMLYKPDEDGIIRLPESVDVTQKKAHLMNYVTSKVRSFFGKSLNAIAANVPVSMDTLKGIADGVTPKYIAHHNNPSSIASAFHANMQGKQMVGVFAQAEKVYAGLRYAASVNGIGVGAPIELEGETYSGIANTETGRQDIQQAWLAFSELINAAVDNAKELLLGRIKANTDSGNIIVVMTAMGVPAEKIFNFIMKNPVVSAVFDEIESSKEFGKGFPESIDRLAKNKKFVARMKQEFGKEVDVEDTLGKLERLHAMASEYTILAKMFSLNQGLPNKTFDLYNFVRGLETDITNAGWKLKEKFSLHKYMTDLAYRRKAVAQFEAQFLNPLEILQKLPHFMKYMKVLDFAYQSINSNSFILRKTDALLEEVFTKGVVRSKWGKADDTVYRQATNYIYGLVVEQHLSRNGAKVIVDNIIYDLAKLRDRDQFMKVFPAFMANRARTSENEFERSLSLTTEKFLDQEYQVLTSMYDMMNLTEEQDIALRADLENLDGDIRQMLYYYSLIANKGGLSKHSFAQLFPAHMDADFHETLRMMEEGTLEINPNRDVFLVNSSETPKNAGSMYNNYRQLVREYNFNAIPYSNDGFIPLKNAKRNFSLFDIDEIAKGAEYAADADELKYLYRKAYEIYPKDKLKEVHDIIVAVAKKKGFPFKEGKKVTAIKTDTGIVLPQGKATHEVAEEITEIPSSMKKAAPHLSEEELTTVRVRKAVPVSKEGLGFFFHRDYAVLVKERGQTEKGLYQYDIRKATAAEYDQVDRLVPFQKPRRIASDQTRKGAGKRFQRRLIDGVIEHMKGVIPGISVEVLSSEELAGINPRFADKLGMVYQGRVLLNEELMEIDTPIHEYGHLIMRWAEYHEPATYNRIVDLSLQHPSYEETRALYPELDEKDLGEEIFVQLLGKHTGLAFDKEEQRFWNRLFDAIGSAYSFFRRMFRGVFGLDRFRLDVDMEMTLEDIIEQISGQIQSGDPLFSSSEVETLRKLLTSVSSSFDSSFNSSKLARIREHLLQTGEISIEC